MYNKDERIPQRLQDVENAIHEFLFLQGSQIDQDKAQDKYLFYNINLILLVLYQSKFIKHFQICVKVGDRAKSSAAKSH